MPTSKLDGRAFLSEMTDDIVLITDVSEPVHGHDAAAALLRRLASLYAAQPVVFERHDAVRDIRVCKPTLHNGETIELITVAFRDSHGWVSEIRLTHTPPKPIRDALT